MLDHAQLTGTVAFPPLLVKAMLPARAMLLMVMLCPLPAVRAP